MSFNIEEFFESIDVIVKQRLSDLSYDKTIIATIVDDTDKERGHYIVSDGTTRFDAYANDMNYKTDDQVRVTIINGDWSQKKFIAGLYDENKANSAVSYMPPLGNIFQTDYAKNQIGTNTNFTLYTNYTPYYQPIWSKQITKDSTEYTLQANGVYNVITLSGDFQTELGDLSAGGYGLMLELYIQPEVDSDERIVKFVTLDSREMIGNPYTFVIDSRQEKQIAIAEAGMVTEIILYIYQGIEYNDSGETIANEFKDRDGVSITERLPIHFRNISIGFGSNLTSIEDNSLKIYTLDPTTYKYNISGLDGVNNKRMGLVWYNKTEDDEYIGFSDGIYQANYDEIDYLDRSYQDNRLTKNADKKTIANDEITLTLAADIQESEPFMIATYEALTTKLSQELQALGRQIPGTSFLEDLTPFISAWTDNEGNTQSAKLVAARITAEEAVQGLVTLCGEIFQYAYNIQHDIEDEWEDEWINQNYITTYQNVITDVLDELTNFFDDMDTQTQTGQIMSGYRGIYSNYRLRADREIAAIRLSMSQVKFTSESEAKLFEYEQKTKADLPSYIKNEFPDDANRYCIYWYRYNKGYNLEYIEGGDNREYQFGQFLGPNWERVTVDKNQTPIQNFGLPGAGEIIDEVQYNLASSPSELLLTRTMVNTTEIEKYQVVLFYNHTMIKSNTLVFTNTEADQIPLEFKADAADVLRIEHDTYSQDHYQSYTEANDLVNIADESRIRQLKCFYDGVFVGDEALADADLYWYIPINSTMLTYDKKYLTDRGFATDDFWNEETGEWVGKTSLSKTGYVYFTKKISYTTTKVDATDSAGNKLYDAQGNIIQEDKIDITNADRYFFYKIKPYYEASAQNNTILVEAHIINGDDSKITTGEIPFTFSSFGTNGTKYTLVVAPNDIQIATLPELDDDGITTNPLLQLKLSLRDGSNNILPMTTQKIIINEGTDDEREEFDIGAYGLEVGWHASNKIVTAAIVDIEGSNEKLVSIANLQDVTNRYVGILDAKISYDEELSDGSRRKITLDTLYPVPFASSNDLYVSGPTTIVYNNQGIVSRLSDEPFKLFRHDTNGDVEENVSWSIAYYYNDGTNLENDEKKEEVMAYMPKLNADNTLIPAPMYNTFEGERKFIVPVVVARNGNSILWSQPIIITQNNYASSTLNDWNGQFEINEANGTIMSTMVGAGRKNEDNTFSGVLMGDIKKGANFDEDNASGLGLYGFHEGAQSFHFGVDGTAFLGKAGRGRIYIDGNKGTIASASYEQYRRNDTESEVTAGMMIDLDDGSIDMHGTTARGEEEVEYVPAVGLLSEDEYNSLWEEDEEHPTYDDYKVQYEADAIATDPKTWKKQSRIRIDVLSPYFTIHSANQIDENKHLIYISDDEYYLQTDNFKSTGFNWVSGEPPFDRGGAGFKLDLKNSLLDAYDLKITSKNVFINSTGDGPYLVIKHNADEDPIKNYKNLMFVNDTNYYLQSADYQTMSGSILGQGMKLTFSQPGVKTGIEAYSFDLRAGSAKGEDHKIVLSDSGNPYLMINTVYNDEVKTLMQISDSGTSTTFYMQSADFSDVDEKGLRISISGHEIKAYEGFKLKAYQTGNSGNFIMINSTNSDDSAHPLRVSDNFKVSWSGAITATGGTFNEITANGGTFNDIDVTGNFTSGTISGATIYASNLYAGGSNAGTLDNTNAQLVATSSGVTIKDATIENCTITNSSIANGDGSAASGSTMFDVTTDGYLTGLGAVLDNLTVEQSLLVQSPKAGITALVTIDGKTKITGNTAIGMDPDNLYDLKIDGDVFIKGGSKLCFGTAQSYIQVLSGDGGSMQIAGAGEVYILTDEVGVGNSGSKVGIGGNPLTEAGTVRLNGKIVIDNPETFFIGSTTGDNLPEYIEKNTTAKYATALASSTGTIGGALTAYDIGSATQPVYFKNGIPVACTELGDLAFKDSVTASVSVAAQSGCTVTNNGNGIYTVSDSGSAPTVYLYSDTLPSSGKHTTSETTSLSTAQSHLWYTACTTNRTVNTSGTIKATVTIDYS